jgi:DNA-binding beta-propeller fold protein YncE
VLNYQNNTVSVYDETTLKPLGVISKGIACPTTMAMSSAGLLYVANACPSTMVVYGSSWSTPLRTIGNGLDGPVAIGIAP